MSSTAAAAAAAEREHLLQAWAQLESAAIVKDVATKGRYINLAVGFLSQRRGCTVDQARHYFRAEIDAYVRQLLANGQVFRAELVLKNLGRPVRYALYEFMANAAAPASQTPINDDGSDDARTESTASTSITAGSNSGDIIAMFLHKSDATFADERPAFDRCLTALQVIRSAAALTEKYGRQLAEFTLEEAYKKDATFRDQMACDAMFAGDQDQQARLAAGLDGPIVWSHMVANKRTDWIVRWLRAQSGCASGPDASDTHLGAAFRGWSLDEPMLEQLRLAGAGPAVRDVLCRAGHFLSDERADFAQQLRRIGITAAWPAHADWLQRSSAAVADLVLQHGFTVLLCRDFVDVTALLALRDAHPSRRHIVEFAAALRDDIVAQPSNISATVSAHLLKANAAFHKQQPLVYLSELLLRDPPVDQVLAAGTRPDTVLLADPSILAQIPLLRVLLTKHGRQQPATINDHTVTLADLVKRHAKIDLKLIRQEAAAGGQLGFDNAALTARYGQPERLGYMFYVKQARSAHAVFVFAVEQLQQYAQISAGQIMYACSMVTQLALQRPDDGELVAHCVAFMEMLGVNTCALRAYLRCVRVLRQSSLPLAGGGGGGGGRGFGELNDAERLQALIDGQAAEPAYDGRNLDALRIVCEAHDRPLPPVFLAKAAAQPETNWLQWLTMASYYDYSLEAVLGVLDGPMAETGSTGALDANMRVNLRTALLYERASERRSNGGGEGRRSAQTSFREQRRTTKMLAGGRADGNVRTSGETMSSSISSTENVSQTKLQAGQFVDQYTDLFAMILRCTVPPADTITASTSGSATTTPNTSATEECSLPLTELLAMFAGSDHFAHGSTFRNLLHTAIQRRWPVFAVLAATVAATEQASCWYVWLTLSTGADVPTATATGADTLAELAIALIDHALQSGCVATLHQSMLLFYPAHPFRLFTDYLQRTADLDFSAASTEVLHSFLLALIGAPDQTPADRDCPLFPRGAADIDRCVRWLQLQLQHGFRSGEHRQLLLDSLCASGLSDHTVLVDFCTLSRLHAVCSFTAVSVDVGRLMAGDARAAQAEHERLRERLVGEREFERALQLADLVQLPRDSIIYEWWVAEHRAAGESFDLGRCERECAVFSLAPELVIQFYQHVADGLAYERPGKYAVLKRIMDVIKRHRLFRSEAINCDRIEYEMVVAYLRGPMEIGELDVYYSDYFEAIIRNERGVLFKTFTELKEISGIEELTVSNKRKLTAAEQARLDALIYRLLDDGDVVQALRLQAIFVHRPLDLHLLVFCMALAEGLASLSDLSAEQEQMNRDARKFAMSRFGRRRTARTNSQSSTTSSPMRPTATAHDCSASEATLEFEEIPSRHKQDILAALQNFAARIQHGQQIAQRIMLNWRAAMYLDKEYADVMHTKDAYELLDNAIADDCMYKLDVMHDIMTAMRLTKLECADFLADKIATSIIRAQFYMLTGSPNSTVPPLPAVGGGGGHTLWGYDLDREFRQFLALSASSAALGNALLLHCDALRVYRRYDAQRCAHPDADEPAAVRHIYRRLRQHTLERRVLSHKKQNTITVELLIKAHECFVHECHMEGIACVLHRTRALCSVLTLAKSWSLVVRMLVGIGRYREMYYCFETLIRHEQFESLLGQFDAECARGLSQACISYLRECCPENGEYFRLAALHFRMYKEVAQMWEQEARALVQRVLEGRGQVHGERVEVAAPSAEDGRGRVEVVPLLLRCGADVVERLQQAMEGYTHATENYLVDNKLALAQQTASMAELVALQIYLVQAALRGTAAAATAAGTTTGGGASPAAGARPIAGSGSAAMCICVVNIPSAGVMKYFVNSILSVPQALILGRAYPYELNWTDALYEQYVLAGNERYLQDYCERMQLTEQMIELLVKQFQHQVDVTPRMELAVGRLVELIETVTTRYRLASVLGLKRCVAALINDHSLYYLKDTNYGRSEGTGSSVGNNK